MLEFLKEVKLALKSWLFCRSRKAWLVRTKLPKGKWFDSDERILYAMMAILDEFYEHEVSLNVVDWDADDNTRQAKERLDEIKAWWDDYPRRKQEIDQTLKDWYDESTKDSNGDFLASLNKPQTEKEAALMAKLRKKEEVLEAEEQRMLTSLIEVRRYMWT